jgi:hypothetical protein
MPAPRHRLAVAGRPDRLLVEQLGEARCRLAAHALHRAQQVSLINKYFNLVDGSPIGGFKDSGYGSENAAETIDLYTHLKSITLIGKPQDPFYLPR